MSFRFRDWPLRSKMAALLVAASLLPLALQAYFDLRQTQARLLDGMKNLLEARGDQIVRELDGFHQGYQRAAERVARFPNSAAYCAASEKSRGAVQAEMLGLLAAYPASDAGIRGAALIDGSGRIVIATEPQLLGVDLSGRLGVQRALQGRAVITDPYVSPGPGAVPTIAYLTPLVGAEQKVTCVAALWVRAAALWDKVKASNALAGADSFAVLFDQEGIRIAHTYSDDIVFHPGGRLDPATVDKLVAERRFGARTRALLEDVREFPEQFERARAPVPDTSVFRGLAPVNQGWNYGVARRFETVPWTVFYMVPEAAFAAEIAQATRERLLFALGIIAAAAIVGFAFATNILKPLRALGRVADSIAGGDLSSRVQESRGDELGRLGAGFNTMADRIQTQAASLQRSRDELDQRVRERTAELEVEISERARVEGVLRERDTALHRAHVMARLAHVITGADGSFEVWSETLPPMIGVAHAQMPRSTREWVTLLHPDDRQAFRSTSISAARTGLRSDVEYRLQRADGAWIHVRQVIEPIPQQSGAEHTTRWFSTLQDITEEKRAQEELRASEEHTRLIVETALDAVITMDRAGMITGWSAQAETIFGWTRTEVSGRLLAQTIIPPLHREAHQRGLERYLATGEAVVLNKRIELTALHRDGHEFPVDVAITPIRTADTVTFSAFVRDITERKLAESRLRAQVERLQLMDQITRAIGERQDLQSIYQVAVRSLEDRLPVDFSCVCRYDAAENTLSVTRVGAHSQPLAMELAMGESARVEIDQNGLSRCLRGELVHEPDVELVPFPFPQRLARGGLRSLVVAPLQSESRVFGILVAARREPHSFSSGDCEFIRQLSAHVALAARQAELHGDLQKAYDDLRQTQQTVMQQERLRALGQMASGIAHDINNAISPVALYTENLLEHEPNLSERGRGQLMTIARAIDDVAATVARMREFYRQREHQLTLLPLQLNSLVPQVVELTRARWSDMPLQRGAVIRLDTDLAPGVPKVMGVESEVREALTNLIFNAVDAMPDGGVLTLRTRFTKPGERRSPTAMVEVTDTGVGMDVETQRRCLEPFFTTKGERGTGLGLAMVYGMTQRHGGEVEIESTAGRGTTVRLSFPVPAAKPVSPVESEPPALPQSRLRILIVDDDPLLLTSLREVLELDGHVVVATHGGQAGIDAFLAVNGRADAFDAVITDLGMPYVDGRTVAGAIKRVANTPVILLTGWGQRLVADGEVPENVDLVLSKPPKLREVRAALALLGDRAAPAAASSPLGDPR